MQYIKDGPDIPEEVEYALRQDNLVLFCGSGISVDNGLPVFKGLVEQICQNLNISLKEEPLLKEAWDRKDYSSVLDMIEGNQSFSVSRKVLREKVIKILSQYKNNPDIHKALLDLSVLPDKKGYRLVTTNFDRLFFEAGLDLKLSDSAPKLAPSRKETWKNLTFLHGLIDESYDPSGDNLVLTRRDFGLAYLHDNWTARFVIQLFQDFTVFFIGYEVNDPVMNYLVSAISYVNHRRKENNIHYSETIDTQAKKIDKNNIKPSIYAFAGYRENEKNKIENKWKSIGVKPIVYKIKDNEDHSLLYGTIKKWAELKTLGLTGKKQWLKKLVSIPYEEGRDKINAKNMFSAIKVNEKLAEYFPEINLSSDPHKYKPVDITWLKAFLKEKQTSAKTSDDVPQYENTLLKKLSFPTYYVSRTPLWEPLSNMERCMMHWLMHHLDNEKLIHQVITECSHPQTGVISLHPEFKYCIKRKLENILSNNENPQLSKRVALFWQIVTTQDTSSEVLISSFNGSSLIRDLSTSYSQSKIKELFYWLKPYIGFETRLPYNFKFPGEQKPVADDPIYEPKLTINMQFDPSLFGSLENNEKALLLHAEDWTNLLKEAMELAKWVGLIEEDGRDNFFLKRPSISPDSQNTTFYPWTYLIVLARDSFDMAIKKDKTLARFLLNKWSLYPYSLFYRLILYAVTKYPDILDETIVIDLLSKNENILWSVSCQNEMLRYLKGRQHAPQAAKQLFSLIIKGPPRHLYENINDKIFVELKEREIYQKLNRMKASGTPLPKDIERRYNSIQSKYSLPNKVDDSDNFPVFHTGVRRSGLEKYYHNMTDEQIFNDIKQNDDFYVVNKKNIINKISEFRTFCKGFPDRGFKVLSMFSDHDKTGIPYWSVFIGETSMMTDAKKSNEWFFKIVEKAENFNDDFFKGCLGSLIFMLNMKGGLIYFKDKSRFQKWWKRLWNLSVKECRKTPPSAITALNSNLGRLSWCIFKALWNSMPDQKITKNGKIPEDIKNYFQDIIAQGLNKEPSVLYHFGHNLWQLWFLDKAWTIKNIRPLMDWHKQPESVYKSLWQGVFYNPSYSSDFLSDFKEEFSQLFLNYKKLLDLKNEHNQYIGVISNLFLILTGGKDIAATFTEKESESLIRKMDVDIFESLTRKMFMLLRDAEPGKSAVLWSNKIKPWIKTFWLQQKNKNNSETALYLSLAVLYCENNFPDAFETLKDTIKNYFTPKPRRYSIADEIYFRALSENSQKNSKDLNKQTKLQHIFNYPDTLLKLLNLNFPLKNIESYQRNNIEKVLNKLKEKHPQIESHTEYKKLKQKLT